ncbi:MAG: hypothetical protein Hyperionvirus10_49 [Hyperionvirus sp.]|uniref:Right handed beta helix domain-containing protein n=1 Tax=Hyperionvirus sp. TaxID=2487770 RepID=A0A3G5ACV0_9VIRU|nr:MAG: hypothetical protein Hyperionvirus10_49 [Hyperionvirus sp.]
MIENPAPKKLFTFIVNNGPIKYVPINEPQPINKVVSSRDCNKSCKKSVIKIRQKDFTKKGYIIKEDNTCYRFVENIIFSIPAGDKTAPAAITILANHVKLDMNGYSLTGVNAPVAIQIGIAPFDYGNVLADITITNGIIRNFSSLGILENGSRNLTISYIDILENVPDGLSEEMAFGIGTNNSLNLVIKNCRITKMHSKKGSFGIFLSKSIATVKNCNVASCISTASPDFMVSGGIIIVNDGDVPFIGSKITNCVVDTIESATTLVSGIALLGTRIGPNDQATIENCSCYNIKNSQVDALAAGIYSEYSRGLTLTDCNIVGVTVPVSNEGNYGGRAQAYLNRLTDVAYNNCKSSGII